MTHIKLTAQRPQINIDRPASGETFNNSQLDDYRF